MLVLVVQTKPPAVRDLASLRADLQALGAAKVQVGHVGPTVNEIDAALSAAGEDERIVVDADLAGLNLVLHRALRAGRLDKTDFAVLSRQQIGYLGRIGLPAERAEQLALAVTGRARLIGVIKDDSGGVCIDTASLRSWQAGEPWWVRAVVDDQRLCDGSVTALRVRRIGPALLEARVQLGRFRSRTSRGRSLQLACDPALITADGVDRERPRSKRTFWSEPELWRLALPR